MIKLKVIDTLGKVHILPLPENLEEVSLNQKIAFDVCNEDIALWIKDSIENEHLFENRTYFLYLLSKTISEFLNYPMHEIMSFDVSDLVDERGELLPNVISDHVNKKNELEIDIASAEVTLTKIYNYITNLLDTYKFSYRDSTNFTFEYLGETWEIPYVVKKLFTGKKIFSKVSVAQCVEILQIKKFLHEKSKEKRTLADSSNIQDLRFSAFLNMFAYTVKKVGEDLPLDDVEYQQLIEERKLHFSKVNMKLAYDVTFFLTNIMMI